MRRILENIRRFNALQRLRSSTLLQTVAVAGPLTTERQLSSQMASTSGQTHSYFWNFASLPFIGLAALGSASAESQPAEGAPQEDGFRLLPLATRQRIFFKYEKRVRDNSTLDKVFEYFSSLERDQQKFLTPVDLVRAIVPTYPPSNSQLVRAGSLDGEQTSGRPQPSPSSINISFFKQFDVDGDGVISFPEFLLVLTLLSIRENDVQTVFDVVDLDGTGDIDLQEFMEVMELLQARAHVYASKIGRSHKLSYGSETGLVVSFFGRDGTKRLSLSQFRSFIARLHEEVVRLEFQHYDTDGRGSVAAVDFARSLASTADVRNVDRLLNKVDAMPPQVANLRFTQGDFMLLHHLHRQLHTLVVALDFMQQVGRPVTRPDLAKLAAKLLDVALPDRVLDVIFELFGNHRGHLDVPAFLEVMQRREIMWARRNYSDPDAQPPGKLRRAITCFRRCMSEDLA